MATILQLKRRILAAQNVSKTTKAMQMIAASKLKKAQDATLFGKPYVEKLTTLAQNISSKTNGNYTHPYLRKSNVSDERKNLVLVFAPDKGLCGGLITNLIRSLLEETAKNKNQVFITVGKKVEGSVTHLGKEILASFKFGTVLPSFEMVYPIAKIIDDYFLTEKADRVIVLNSAFINLFSQKPKITTILPIQLPQDTQPVSEFTLFEPNPQELLPSLLKH